MYSKITRKLYSDVANAQVQEIALNRIGDDNKNPYVFESREHTEDERDSLKEHFTEAEMLHPLVLIDDGEGDFQIALGLKRLKALRSLGRETAKCKVLKLSDYSSFGSSSEEIKHLVKLAVRTISITETEFSKQHEDRSFLRHIIDLRNCIGDDVNSKDLWRQVRQTFGIYRENPKYRHRKRLFEAAGIQKLMELYNNELLIESIVADEKVQNRFKEISDAVFAEIKEEILAIINHVRDVEDLNERTSPLDFSKYPAKEIRDSILKMRGGPQGTGLSQSGYEKIREFVEFPTNDDNVELEYSKKFNFSSSEIDLDKLSPYEAVDLVWSMMQMSSQTENLISQIDVTESRSFSLNRIAYGKPYLKFLKENNLLQFANYHKVRRDNPDFVAQWDFEKAEKECSSSEFEKWLQQKIVEFTNSL